LFFTIAIVEVQSYTSMMATANFMRQEVLSLFSQYMPHLFFFHKSYATPQLLPSRKQPKCTQNVLFSSNFILQVSCYRQWQQGQEMDVTTIKRTKKWHGDNAQ
jgi:hypothetical protein